MKIAGIVICILLTFAPQGSQFLCAETGPVKSVWVAFGEDVLRMNADNASLILRIPSLSGIRRIGLDEGRSTLWAYGNKTLLKFNLNGQLLLSIPVPLPAGALDDVVRLEVNPSDGSVWLSLGPYLWKFSNQGAMILPLILPRNICGLSLDSARSLLWVATDKKISRRNIQTGAEELEISAGQEQIKEIDVELSTGNLWVAADKNIYRYAANGTSQFKKSFKDAVLIASDFTGGAWIAANKKLLRLNSTGNVLIEVQPFNNATDLGSILSLVADPRDSSVWAANQNKLLRIGIQGNILYSLIFRGPLQMADRLRDLALSLSAVETHAPVISFTAPANGAVIETRTPQIDLNYSDEDNDIKPQSLHLVANGSDDLTSTCSIGNNSATCVTVNPLPEGANNLTATIEDEAGNVSNSAQVNFTITIPPDPLDVDDDDDGITENQGDCNDTTPAIYPGATEVCNAVDDNCNTVIDEGGVCNQPPFITSTPALLATVGDLYTYDAEASDPDAGDTLTFSLNIFPDGMTIDPSSGLIQWTPDETGTVDVDLNVKDNGNLFATQTYQITVSAPPNQAPFAFDDRYAVRLRKTLTVQAPGVLENDVDPDDDSLTAQLDTNVTKGTLDFSSDGSFAYTPSEPAPGSTEPVLKFAYQDPITSTGGATRSQPLVIDLNKDGVAEIVFYAQHQFSVCHLTAVHGNDGSEYFRINGFQPNALPEPIVICDPFSELAAGDIDGDGFPEIIAVDTHDGSAGDDLRHELIAFNHDGTYRWTSQNLLDDPLVDSGGFTKPVIADLTGDGNAEIIVGYSGRGPLTPGAFNEDFVTVYNNQGQIVWTARGGGSSGDGFQTAVVSDINLDGRPEILYSDDVFDSNGNRLFSVGTCGSCLNVQGLAVANLDDDPFAEVVYQDRYGGLYVYEHTGVKKWGRLALSGSGVNEGTPAVGDVDGNGTPEIVVTGYKSIWIVSRDGSTTRSIPVPYALGGYGGNPTIFDLNGDGKPEILHVGERGPYDVLGMTGALYIWDGETGTLLHSMQASRNAAAHDQGPIVADVDGNGTAEIVTGGWNENNRIHVFASKNGQWMRARPVWNQLSYHVTNVNSDGTIPSPEAINWLTPGLNNYLVNIPLPEERNGQGTDVFKYKASDGDLDSNSATVTIDILPPNTAPSILSEPLKTASASLEYIYAVRAVDPDAGEVLNFTLPKGPAGMTIDASTGLVRWSPDASQTGEHLVVIKVTDSQGEFVFQGYTIQVVGAVAVPNVLNEEQANAESLILSAGLVVGTITNSPSDTVPAGQVISQEPTAGTLVSQGSPVNLVISTGEQSTTVPDLVGQTRTSAFATLAGSGLTMGSITTSTSDTVPSGSVISQDPQAGQSAHLGSPVNLVISTGTVSLENLVSIIVNPVAPIILKGQTQPFTATGIFDDDTSLNVDSFVVWTSGTPSVAAISPGGVASGTGIGFSSIQATVNNIAGNTLLTVAGLTPGDTAAPTAEITAPPHNSSVTGPVSIIGTATDTNFLKYELEYAPAGEANFALLQTGTAPVTNGTLGSFDSTLLLNDIYTIRLTVFDKGGNASSASVSLQGEGNRKIGLFSLTFTDLSIPVSGLPIVVNRVYDSRDKKTGDFGVGWRLDVQTMRIRTNRVPGTGWVRQQSGAVINLIATDQHKVSVFLPDGKVEVFDMIVSPTSGFGGLDATSVTGYAPRPGTVGTLEALANNSLLILNAGLDEHLVDDETLNTYEPQLYRYTSEDGTKFEIHRTEGVKKITDRNGNVLTFGPNGILHSSGEGTSFLRDGLGRITQVTDPMGATQIYSYDANGDLVSHTDRVGSVTHFKYATGHYLLEIINPNGVRVTRNEYDNDGRLIAIIDPDGNRFEQEHDLANQVEIQRDPDGTQRIFAYDARGNVVSETDELGHTTHRTYDANDFLLSETDQLGNTITFTRDSSGRETSRRNASGNITGYTYDTSGQMTSMTDPLGNVTTYTLDSNGNRVQTQDPSGNVTSFSYDAKGNLLTTTDPSGRITHFEYDSGGRRNKTIDALGHSTRITYNGIGNPTSVSTEVTTPNGVQTLTSSIQYDANGRPVVEIDTAGGTTRTEYDAAGNVTATVDPLGRQTSYAYNSKNQPTGITLADGTPLSSAYDLKGRMIKTVDRNGLDVFNSHDAAGNVTGIIYPDQTPGNPDDNPVQRLEYNAARKVTGLVNELGERINLSYDASGRVTGRQDALGNSTSVVYDAAGRVISQTDALGHTTQTQYDELNRITKITMPDGTTIMRTYDPVGNVITEKDPNGNITQFEYDALNRRTAIMNAAGGRTEYQYDELGRLVLQRDANHNVTLYEYDSRGLNTAIVRSMGQRQTRNYDAAGLLISETDFNGTTTQFFFDDLSRLIEKRFPDGTSTKFTYTQLNHPASMIDSHGTTSFTYDVRGRLSSRIEPDGRTISYSYDDANRVATITTPTGTTTYTYDLAGRILTVTDPDSGTTSYDYDAAGKMIHTGFPNGTSENRTYNSRDFLTQLVTVNPANSVITSFQSTFDAIGNQTSVVDHSGRTVAYTYDPIYRLIQETITPVSGTPRSIAYSYDSVGNRLSRNDSVAGITTYQYDGNDRLLSETLSGADTNYTYDNNGNRLTSTSIADQFLYQWDFENRLRSVTQSGSQNHTAAYVYNGSGTRVSQTIDGVETRYLVDSNRPFAEVIEEYTPAGQSLASYVYGNRRISRRTPSDREYYHGDVLGSTRALTNLAGSITSTAEYDAFGRVLQQTGSSQPFLFAGQQVDPVTDFTYLRARYLDRNTGQFISSDPFPGLLDDPMSLHRYIYANANPVNMSDPSGQMTISEAMVTTFLISTVLAIGQASFSLGLQETDWVGWKGQTMTLAVNTNGVLGIDIGGSELKSDPERRKNPTFTTARHLLILFGFASPNLLPNTGTAVSVKSLKDVPSWFISMLGSKLLFQWDNTELASPGSMGGTLPIALSGAYLNMGGFLKAGLTRIPAGIRAGGSFVIQGSAIGVRVAGPIAYSSGVAVRAFIHSGVSLDVTPRDLIQQPDFRSPE